MNVIVSNKYQNMLGTLDIDVIKSINGVYDVEDLVAIFNNFYFNKMIIDITALKGYENVKNLQKLSVNFDTNKIIILLDDSSVVNSGPYMSQPVSMGIYNFTRNVNAIKFLIDNANTYKDVAHYHNLNGSATTEENINFETLPNSDNSLRVIGFKNVTSHAGSTTLVYMLKRHLEIAYSVIAIEADSEDFKYLNDKSLKSCNGMDLSHFISNTLDTEVILVDLNDSNQESLCNDVVYLIEPGLIKLNKLIRQDREIFDKLEDKKIILNKSILTDKDISDFESESGSKVFFNIPYLDDKKEHEQILDDFLVALGFSRINSSNTGKAKIFNIFK